jgi:hypothetical protein
VALFVDILEIGIFFAREMSRFGVSIMNLSQSQWLNY